MIIVYHRERIQLEVSQRKKYIWQSLRKCGTPSCPLPMESRQHYSLTSLCDNTHGVVPDRKLLQALVFRVFIGAPSPKYGWLSKWQILVFSPSGCWADTRASSLHHIVVMAQNPHSKTHYYYLTGSRFPGKQIPSHQLCHSKGLRITNQKLRAKTDLS